MGSCLLAVAVNRLISDGLFPSLAFVAAVMVTVHVGGKGPGILAFLIAGLLLDFYYIPPVGSFSIHPDAVPSLVQLAVPIGFGWWFIQRRKDVELLLERETAVSKRLQGELSYEDIGRAVLDYLAPELGSPIAALYTLDADGTARRCAGYAFDMTKAPETFARGDGAIGQVASESRPQVLSVPPDYISVRSSLGARRPSTVVIAPASDGERVRAVVELGFFGKVDRPALELLDRIGEPLAVAVRSAAYRTQLQNLLDETRRQAEELKAHEDELRAANEELEEHGQVMQETQRKLEAQQAELEEGNQALARQARLLEEQNEELAQAHEVVRIKSESAERANKTKSEFLANMSHELRTPLNSSLILSKLLAENKEGNLSDQQVRSAETIYSAGNDLLAMIDDILDLAKIEAGKLDVRSEEVLLSRVREDMLRTFGPIAAERKLGFHVRIADGAPESVRTDSQRLGQILKNLLSNALKFTERGEVSLLMVGDAAGVRFAVRDSGIGIPDDQLARIFEAFRQVDGTTNRKYGGTGLGLSISRELSQLLGGEITVSSTEGRGSTFTLTLPSAFAGTAPVAQEATVHRTPTARLAAPKPRTADVEAAPDSSRAILVIEDDERFSQIVVDLAREMDFDATVAATADDAIHYATGRPPKGIILDMKLPDHSGLSVLDRLKRDPRTRHIPVHCISFLDHTRAALEMGAVGYFVKPVEREQIQTALRKLESEFTRRSRRLLVVEDDLVQREAICQLFRSDSVEIVAVGTVKEALQELRGGPLDCVVTDLALPDASGYDLLETMAGDEAYSFPSVVVYTGRSLTADDEQRLRQYSSSIIVKGARSPERLLDEVTLFLHQVESTLPPERQRMLKKARHREAIFEGRSVLVVEDDVRNIFALTSVLEPKGMKVTIARNGREALEALELEPGFDVVLMDIMMPEMDGLEAMRAIRGMPRFARLPIIALTAKAMKDDLERCMQAGASDYIPKPIDLEMLLSLLRIWMPR